MRAIDIIMKKREAGELSEAEISFLINGYVDGSIPEYQVSAFLMAVFFQGMTARETSVLTNKMIESGSVIDLSGLDAYRAGALVDKHSTGGVGDKVSLILAPMVAAAGAQVPMMSGRGLGHTGGTLDKLESIPGYSTALDPRRFAEIIASCGFAMTGQSKDIVPADKKLYALRDVTATVESVPLITASILSKKFAEGAQHLVFDVKYGAGAFMKTDADARILAESLVRTGQELGRGVTAVITNMDVPLGSMVGNFLEVEESIACLENRDWNCDIIGGVPKVTGRSGDLMEVTITLSAWMLVVSGIAADFAEALDRSLSVLADGSALGKFWENVALQGGDRGAAEKLVGVRDGLTVRDISAPATGFLSRMNAYKVGSASVILGAGRNVASDDVLPDVGIEVLHKPGEKVDAGQPLLRLFAREESALDRAEEYLADALDISEDPPRIPDIIHSVVQ
jgi:pyrimidine-nucleoside phosphorylase